MCNDICFLHEIDICVNIEFKPFENMLEQKMYALWIEAFGQTKSNCMNSSSYRSWTVGVQYFRNAGFWKQYLLGW